MVGITHSLLRHALGLDQSVQDKVDQLLELESSYSAAEEGSEERKELQA